MTLPFVPVCDRTEGDAAQADSRKNDAALNKGALNAADLNRIESNCQYLADALNGYGYYVEIRTKVDWAETDWPTKGQVDRIRNNILALIAAYHRMAGSPEIGFGEYLDVQDANALEQNLEDIDTLLGWMVDGFRYSGTFFSGQEVILP